jgi:hypothetical protein
MMSASSASSFSLLASCCLLLYLACAPSSSVNYARPAAVSPSTPSQAGATPSASGTELPEGAKEILADGVAAISGDAGIARDHALQDAQRKAVEQGVGTLISSETAVKNFQLIQDEIYSKATGYVSSYKILNEEHDANLYRVTIRAIVKLANLKDDLAAIGTMIQKQGRPRLMVLIRDTKAGTDVVDPEMASELETMLIDQFVGKGFPVVDAATVQRNLTGDQVRLIMDGDNKTAALLGNKVGAEIVLAGKATAAQSRKTVPYTNETQDFYATKLNVRAVNVQTAEILTASLIAKDVPFSQDASRRGASEDAADKMIGDILKKWQTEEIVTQIYCTNADNDKLKAVQSDLNLNLRGVVKVLLRDFTGKSGVVEVLSTTSSQEVYDRLNATGWKVPFTIKGFSGNRIDLEFK